MAVGLAVAALAVAGPASGSRQPVFDTAISFMVPFAAYLPAEQIGYHELHGSGVIAVVIAGLMLGHKSPVIQSGPVAAERAGQLGHHPVPAREHRVPADRAAGPSDRRRRWPTSTLSGRQIAGFCVAVLVRVIVLRMVWVFRCGISLFRRRARRRPERRGALVGTLVVGWAGLRGVVTLATALLIPDERPAPRGAGLRRDGRHVSGTLLLQGLTLPPLVRGLHLRGPDAALRRAAGGDGAADGEQRGADELWTTSTGPGRPGASSSGSATGSPPGRNALWERLGRPRRRETPPRSTAGCGWQTLQAERDEVLEIRSTGTVDHEVIEEVLGSFDIEESMLTIAGERADELDEGGRTRCRTPVDPIGPCQHLEAAPDRRRRRRATAGCQDCVREGTDAGAPADLPGLRQRRLLRLLGRPARRPALPHTEHPVMRSFEPGEDWRWCYVDERLG